MAVANHISYVRPVDQLSGPYATPWFAHLTPRPDADIRVFCIGAAGSGASVWRNLAPSTDTRIEVLPVQLPGRETRRSEDFLTDIHEIVEELADAIEPLLDKPFVLMGHSLGGLIAYELAAELSRFGQAPLHLIALGTPAPHLPRTRPTVHDRGEQALRDYLVRMSGTPGAVLETRWLFDMYAPVLRADLQVFETYVHGKQSALPCPITCWGGTDDPHVGPELLEEWGCHTSDDLQVELWDGNHFFTKGRDAEVGQKLAELLLD